MLRIKLVDLYVDDQDKALAFYTDKLGFEVENDVADGDYRWLTILAPNGPAGLELMLAKADDAARALQEARRASGTPALSLGADDIHKAYETLIERGVTFTMPPTKLDYGGTDAVLDDTCGNLINLHQD